MQKLSERIGKAKADDNIGKWMIISEKHFEQLQALEHRLELAEKCILELTEWCEEEIWNFTQPAYKAWKEEYDRQEGK